MRLVPMIFCLLTSLMFLTACGKQRLAAVRGLPDEVFQPEKESQVRITTAGELTQAHVLNTMSLKRANMKLHTICLALDLGAEICGATE